MSKHHQKRAYGAIKTILATVAIFTAMSVLLLWSWNTLAVDLFQLPEARFKHAVAFGLLIAGGFLFRIFTARFTTDSSLHSGRHGGVVS